MLIVLLMLHYQALCGVIRDISKGCIFSVFSGVKHKAET